MANHKRREYSKTTKELIALYEEIGFRNFTDNEKKLIKKGLIKNKNGKWDIFPWPNPVMKHALRWETLYKNQGLSLEARSRRFSRYYNTHLWKIGKMFRLNNGHRGNRGKNCKNNTPGYNVIPTSPNKPYSVMKPLNGSFIFIMDETSTKLNSIQFYGSISDPIRQPSNGKHVIKPETNFMIVDSYFFGHLFLVLYDNVVEYVSREYLNNNVMASAIEQII